MKSQYEKDVERAHELDRQFADSFCDVKHYTKEELRIMVKERKLIRLRSSLR